MYSVVNRRASLPAASSSSASSSLVAPCFSSSSSSSSSNSSSNSCGSSSTTSSRWARTRRKASSLCRGGYWELQRPVPQHVVSVFSLHHSAGNSDSAGRSETAQLSLFSLHKQTGVPLPADEGPLRPSPVHSRQAFSQLQVGSVSVGRCCLRTALPCPVSHSHTRKHACLPI